MDRRIKDLQDNLKDVRRTFVLDVRAARVSGWGEETQEFLLKLRGGTGSEIRLRPPCGYTLEECTCGVDSRPPQPVQKGALGLAVAKAKEIGGAAAAASAVVSRDSCSVIRGDENDGRGAPGDAVAGRRQRSVKRRRVLNDEGGEEGYPEEGGRRQAGSGPSSSHDGDHPHQDGRNNSSSSSRSSRIQGSGGTCSSLDEIKRQMGKNPLELERSRNALEAEMRGGTFEEGKGTIGAATIERSDSTAARETAAGKNATADRDSGGGGDGVARAGDAPLPQVGVWALS